LLCNRIEYNIDPQIPHNIIADPFLIRQVFSNLINNSIKYTKSGKIVLSIQLLDKNTLKFSVMDTGIGISSLQLQNIFLPYKQIDGMFKNRGIGMRLSICNENVKKLNGTLDVCSEVDKGSTFSFTIPITMN
jgi:signal transduction histidine kinase